LSVRPTTALGGHISTEPRINERIHVNEVRLVGPAGEQVGIVRIEDALRLAREADLDLVEVAPMARPPVAKLMDYGKFKYEAAQKARESRRNQTNTVIKEMKLRPKIDSHDYETKKGHVVRFLKAGDKVKITIMFRGREQSRPELGFNLLKKLADDVVEDGFIESAPKQDGRNMLMVLSPTRKKTEAKVEVEAAKAARAATRAADAEAERKAQEERRRTEEEAGAGRQPGPRHRPVRKRKRHHAQDEDPFRGQEALSRHRHRQGDAPPGRQDAPQRAQADQPDPPPRRRQGRGEGRREEGSSPPR
jgi:translation initiation factor IF-3